MSSLISRRKPDPREITARIARHAGEERGKAHGNCGCIGYVRRFVRRLRPEARNARGAEPKRGMRRRQRTERVRLWRPFPSVLRRFLVAPPRAGNKARKPCYTGFPNPPRMSSDWNGRAWPPNRPGVFLTV